MMRIAIPAALLLLAACAAPAPDDPAAADTSAAVAPMTTAPAADTSAAVAPMATAPAADTSAAVAPMATAPAAGPPLPLDSAAAPAPSATEAAARDTGYTAWSPVELPSEPWMQRAATPAALLTRVRDVVAAQLEEPDAEVLLTRMHSRQADSAVAVLVHPDLADDSVRDIEFRLHMRRDGAEWAIVGVDRRERCRRGVTDDNLCA